MPLPGFGLDLSGNESNGVGSIARRGHVAIDYDSRAAAMTFEIRGFYDFFPWAKGIAYETPKFKLEDLEDLLLLLHELKILVGKQPEMPFEKRLATGHYESIQRRKSFLPDALKEIGLVDDDRAREMLKASLANTNGDVKRAWVLFKAMAEASGISSAAGTPAPACPRP